VKSTSRLPRNITVGKIGRTPTKNKGFNTMFHRRAGQCKDNEHIFENRGVCSNVFWKGESVGRIDAGTLPPQDPCRALNKKRGGEFHRGIEGGGRLAELPGLNNAHSLKFHSRPAELLCLATSAD
jgi:hypothetical protein